MDRTALKTLFDTFWSPAGWVDNGLRDLPPEAFAQAKEAGIMFDPCFISHDELVQRAHNAFKSTTQEDVANAFLASLSTRRLDARSALGSWVYLKNLPNHSHSLKGQCGVCGRYDHPKTAKDLNGLNFERFKWGGVRHDDMLYAAFDLERFSELDPFTPTADDRDLFRQLLAAIASAPADTTAPKLHRLLPKTIKSNESERNTLLDVLGMCGILETKAHQGYLAHFVNYADRKLPPHRFADRTYPFVWWHGSDGINSVRLNDLFGL